jgi:hypothetical protein
MRRRLDLGIRQYWQNFESLERWARSSVHAGWWKNFVQKPTGYGLWHETYFIRGGIEAIYGDVPPPLPRWSGDTRPPRGPRYRDVFVALGVTKTGKI